MAETSLLFNILGRDGVSRVFRDIRGEARQTEHTFDRVDGAAARMTKTTVGGLGGVAAKAAGLNVTFSAVAISLGAITAAASAASVAAIGAVGGFAALGAFALRKNEEVKKSFTDLGEHISARLAELAAPLEPVFKQIATNIGDTFDRIAPQIGRIFEVIGPHISTITNAFLQLVEKVMPSFVRLIEESSPAVSALATFISEDLAEGLSKFFNSMAEGMPEAARVLGWLLTGAAKSLGALGALFANTSREVTAMVDWVSRESVEMKNNIVHQFGVMGGYIETIWNGIKLAASVAVDWIVSQWNRVTGFFDGLLGRVAAQFGVWVARMYSAGQDIVSGLVNGIASIGGRIRDKIMGIVRGAWNSVLSFFGIASPAKEAIWAAQQIGAGFVKGFAGVEGSVARGAGKLAQAASPMAQMGSVSGAGVVAAGGGAAGMRAALEGMEATIDERGGKVITRIVNKQNNANRRR